MRFTLNIRMRPIRIAFFVPPDDRESVARAISICSVLWGGHLNPIIPQFTRLPKHWKNEPASTNGAQDLINGYLTAFDPDFVAFLNCAASKSGKNHFRSTIDANRLVESLKSTGFPSYGIGYFELARYIGYEEMRFERREPLQFVAPQSTGKYQCFLSAVVGSFPAEIADSTHKQLSDAYKAPAFNTSIASFGECLRRTHLTPMRLMRYKLKPDVFASTWERNCILYLDASSLLDVLDYWNLRAIGYKVLPVPLQASTQPSVIDAITTFATENHVVSRHDPKITFNVRVVRGRSVPKHDFDQFVNTCPALLGMKGSPVRPLIQNWFPQFWDQWHREHNRTDCIRFFADSAETELVPDDNWLRFTPVLPEFPDTNRSGLSVANEVTFRTYADEIPIAQVYPQASERLARQFGGFGLRDEWRFSASGPVHFPRMRGFSQFAIPKAQSVVEGWFESHGWKTSTSQAGLAARELLKHLGGAYLASAIADLDTVGLLTELSRGKPISYKQLKAKASKIANRRDFDSPEKVISILLGSKLIALGVQVKCRTCGRHPWYELDSLRPTVECTECLSNLELPLDSPQNGIEWAYRGIGPLIALTNSTGAIPVILALRFITVALHMNITPAFGVEISNGTERWELDLAGFLAEGQFGRLRTRAFFAECKTHLPFSRTDIQRMRTLGSRFPGSALIFSTLRQSLSSDEVKLISGLARKGRRRVGPEQPVNPVMVLTGTELFTPYSLNEQWDSTGGLHAALLKTLPDERNLLGLCSATQQLYLGLDPMPPP